MEGSCFYETSMLSIGAYFTNECIVRITLQQLNRQRAISRASSHGPCHAPAAFSLLGLSDPVLKPRKTFHSFVCLMKEFLGPPFCHHGAGILACTEDRVKLPAQPERRTGIQMLSPWPVAVQVFILPLPGPRAAAGAECRGGRGMPHTQPYRRGTRSRSFGLSVTRVECLPLRVLEIIK